MPAGAQCCALDMNVFMDTDINRYMVNVISEMDSYFLDIPTWAEVMARDQPPFTVFFWINTSVQINAPWLLNSPGHRNQNHNNFLPFVWWLKWWKNIIPYVQSPFFCAEKCSPERVCFKSGKFWWKLQYFRKKETDFAYPCIHSIPSVRVYHPAQ